jgi:hypothetical protein
VQYGNPETFRLFLCFLPARIHFPFRLSSRIKNILNPNLYYRTEIGDRWAEDSDKLHNWGYLR